MVPMVLLVLRVETMTRASSELCYYQPYYKQLTCTCSHDDQMKESNYLGLKMIHYVRTLGQEVCKRVGRVKSREQILIWRISYYYSETLPSSCSPNIILCRYKTLEVYLLQSLQTPLYIFGTSLFQGARNSWDPPTRDRKLL